MDNKTNKILAINNIDNGSTGNIACSILLGAKKKGFDVILACMNPKRKDIPVFNISTSHLNRTMNHLKSRLMDNDGFCSNKNTYRLISLIEKEKPGIIHLHNLHDYYINIKVLLSYLKTTKINVVWTFHDCWPFTGKCPNFIHNNCNKWMLDCSKCPSKHEYPKSYLLCKSKKHLEIKKILFNDFKNLTIVCPSKWMQKQVKQSIARNSNIVTIYNGIHNDFFDYTGVKNSKDTINVISVAYPWTPYKNLDIIEKTAKSLEYNNSIKFIVVGITKKADNKNLVFYPKLDRKKLIELYDSSSVLFNPSIEESFGLTNVEAQSRGIPAIIAKDSGGSEETIVEGKTGLSLAINKNDFSNEIIDFLNSISKETSNMCKENANRFTNEKMVNNYIDLFKSLLKIRE